MHSTYFIVGATGHQGGAVARQLLAKGHEVHAIVRNIESSSAKDLISRGAKLAQGSYDDGQLLHSTIAGSGGVFLNPYVDPADITAQVALSRNVIKAAIKSGTVKHIVASSAFQTGRYHEFLAKDQNFPMRWYYEHKFAIEQTVQEMAKNGAYTWTILRPSWLMFDYMPPQGTLHYPELYTPSHELGVVSDPAARMPHFSEDDLGAFAVAAFEQPRRFHGESIELSHEGLTSADIARELSEASGLEVSVRQRSDEEKEKMWAKVPTQGFHVMISWADLTSPKGHLDKYGIRLTSLGKYLQKYGNKLRAGFASNAASTYQTTQQWGIKG